MTFHSLKVGKGIRITPNNDMWAQMLAIISKGTSKKLSVVVYYHSINCYAWLITVTEHTSAVFITLWSYTLGVGKESVSRRPNFGITYEIKFFFNSVKFHFLPNESLYNVDRYRFIAWLSQLLGNLVQKLHFSQPQFPSVKWKYACPCHMVMWIK